MACILNNTNQRRTEIWKFEIMVDIVFIILLMINNKLSDL